MMLHTTYFKIDKKRFSINHNSDWSGPAYVNLGGATIELPGQLFREIALGILQTADEQQPLSHARDGSHLAFDALHTIYHERDFRVRVNDNVINLVARVLATCVGSPDPKNAHGESCRACKAGFDYDATWSNELLK